MSENEMKNLSEENPVPVQDEESKPVGSNTATIRLILHLSIIVILLLGIVGVVSKKITIPLGTSLLLLISIWNAAVYHKQDRPRDTIFTAIISGIVAIILIMYFLLEFNVL